MRDRLVHRGPDAAGEYADDAVALGIRRLRVIDLVTGDQPQSNEDGRIWTVFNGEIYNFQSLRDGLAARGHRFSTRSDTEVIVHLYEEHGDAFVEHLDGMFAIAVWDARSATLVLARDRLGKKPLLYHERDGEISFASEHRALLAALPAAPTVVLDAVALYLQLGYVPAPLDAIGGIKKLPPGHVLTWRNGRTVVRRYWSLPEPGTLRISDTEAIAEVRRLIDAAVARRLVADVPIGAFLSGGVDSSCVVAAMAKAVSRVTTFTIDFEDRAYSEAAHARRVAERFSTDHHELRVGPADLNTLPLLARHYGEPYADSSALPTFFLSRLTRRHVTVALNGDGGDEVFAGYDRYRAMALAERVPFLLRRPLSIAGALIPQQSSDRSVLGRAKRFLTAADRDASGRYLSWVRLFSPEAIAGLVEPSVLARLGEVEIPHTHDVDWKDPVAAAQGLDLRLYLPDDLLVKVDIASMANSLEVRSPLLDRDLVEFVVRLPSAQKLRGGHSKYLLKHAFAGEVPDANLVRRKQGFGVPIASWFKQDLGSYARDLLLSAQAQQRGYFRTDRVRALLEEQSAGSADHTHRLWSLVMFELWHRELIDTWASAA